MQRLHVMRLIFALTIIFLFPFAYGQTIKKLIEIGDQYYADGDYYGASLEYGKAVAIDSVDIHLLYKYAESLRLYNNHTLAQWYYQKIFAKDRGRIYPLGVFWLAEMQKHNQAYRSALKTWKKAASLHKKDKTSYEYLWGRRRKLATPAGVRRIEF